MRWRAIQAVCSVAIVISAVIGVGGLWVSSASALPVPTPTVTPSAAAAELVTPSPTPAAVTEIGDSIVYPKVSPNKGPDMKAFIALGASIVGLIVIAAIAVAYALINRNRRTLP